MPHPKKNAAVLGIGNPLMGDDAFGSFVIQELNKQPGLNADLIDAGTDPTAVLDAFFKYPYVILIDAIDFKAKPGTLCRVCFSVLRRMYHDLAVSLHNLNPVTILKLAEQMHKRSGKTERAKHEGYLLGIQPENISPGLGLSHSVEKALPRAADFIIKTLPTKGKPAVISSIGPLTNQGQITH